MSFPIDDLGASTESVDTLRSKRVAGQNMARIPIDMFQGNRDLWEVVALYTLILHTAF
jgi:hypothetical protein